MKKETFVIVVAKNDKKMLVEVSRAIDESKLTFYNADEAFVLGREIYRLYVKGTQKQFDKLMEDNKKLFPNGRMF